MRLPIAAAAATLFLAGCNNGELSTEEVRAAAMQRVSNSAGLTMQSARFSDVFVGESEQGEDVLCGTVEGTRANGSTVPAVRFVAAMETDEWVVFERATGFEPPSEPDKFVEWHTACLGERTVPR